MSTQERMISPSCACVNMLISMKGQKCLPLDIEKMQKMSKMMVETMVRRNTISHKKNNGICTHKGKRKMYFDIGYIELGTRPPHFFRIS